MRATWVVFSACLIYALCAVGLDLGHVPHDRLVILVVQHALLLPLLVVTLRRVREVGDAPIRVPDLDHRVAIAIAVVAAIAIVLIARFWNRGILWGDEDAYRVQAQMFASGRPWADAPLPTSPDAALSAAELRFNHHIIHDGHWFTKYPPLWPAVLMLGQLGQAPWLVNPLLAIVALWIVYRIATRELALPNPLLALVMLLTSPYFFMMAASQMSHMLGLVCCAGAVLCFLNSLRTKRIGGLVGAMVLIGACAFVRPFTAFCAAIGIMPFAVGAVFADRKQAMRLVPIGFGLGLATVAGVALYNHLYTGHYGQSPYALYRGTDLPVELSFAPSVIIQNLKDAVRWSIQDTVVFTWPLMFALAGYTLWTDRARRYQNLLLLSFFVVFGVSNLFHTEGSSSRFGDRYLFEAIFGPVLLAARGAALLVERYRIQARAVNAAAIALTLAGMLQAGALVRPTLLEIRPYTQVHDTVDALPADGSLVFFPVTDEFTGDRFDLNAAAWRDAPHLFLVDPGPERRAAVAAAEGRARWIVVGYDSARGEPIVLASGASR